MRQARTTPPWLWLALVVAAALAYIAGLDSPFAPTNGDEMVYIHIARMTAESGHWSQHWSLFALRLPSVVYTFLTTALLAFFAHRISGSWRTACVAAAVYLLYFSTFRYGRAYLTSAPETFWLALPMWWVLWLRVRGTSGSDSSGMNWGVYTLMGVAMGLGSAYKSFALLAPTAAGLWCAWLLSSGARPNWSMVWRSAVGLAWSTLLGIGIFALWFVLDPDPAAVWQEFVLAENAGKMSNTQGYWHAALFGAYPMWTQLLAYPINAGLLILTVFGLAWTGIKPAFQRQTYVQLTPSMRVLLTWLAVWLIVFTIPSQRSERYLIPAMPALAIVMALAWERIPRLWFAITLALAAPALVMLARVAWVMSELHIASNAQGLMTLTAAGIGMVAAIAGLIKKDWCKPATLLEVLTIYATFGLMVQPLGNEEVDYSPAVKTQLVGRRVAVPNGFTGQFERFHFVLPGAQITPYDAEGRNTGALKPELPGKDRLEFLLDQFDAVVWLQDTLAQQEPTCLPDCTLLGARWHVKSRHKEGEVTLDNLWYPQQWLFRREWLLTRQHNSFTAPLAQPSTAPPPGR